MSFSSASASIPKAIAKHVQAPSTFLAQPQESHQLLYQRHNISYWIKTHPSSSKSTPLSLTFEKVASDAFIGHARGGPCVETAATVRHATSHQCRKLRMLHAYKCKSYGRQTIHSALVEDSNERVGSNGRGEARELLALQQKRRTQHSNGIDAGTSQICSVPALFCKTFRFNFRGSTRPKYIKICDETFSENAQKAFKSSKGGALLMRQRRRFG